MPSEYENRMLRVLAYIHANPAGDLSLDALADVAAMSRFHWHRVFHAMTGETCAQAVRRVRMNRAACWLAQTDWPIAEVAARAGYPTVQSFGRQFRQTYGLSPGAFRKTGAADAPHLLTPDRAPSRFDVVIEPHPARRVAAVIHVGPLTETGGAFDRFSAIATARNLWPRGGRMIGIYPDDPTVVPAPELRAFAGFEVLDDAPLPGDLEEIALPATEVARLRFRGPYSGLQSGYDHLFGTWLPGSGRDPADLPPFEVYQNTPATAAPADLLTDICLPLT